MVQTQQKIGFPAGTMIHTDQGLMPIQEIKVGDMVLSRPKQGGENAPTEYKRVVRAFCAGEVEVVRLLSKRQIEWDDWDDGRNFVQFITHNHLVWVEQRKKWISVKDLQVGELLSGVDNTDGQKLLSIDLVFKGSLDKAQHFGICLEPSLGLDDSRDVSMYIDFDSKGYSVNYNRFYTGYKGYLFDRSVYFRLDSKLEKIVFDDFYDHSNNFLMVAIYNIEVEEFQTYFIGQQSIWVHAANS
jgi:hypothetical protein